MIQKGIHLFLLGLGFVGFGIFGFLRILKCLFGLCIVRFLFA
ncbi:hypothetical protein [Helicobacter sp. UBA3407]|nr:hypothetical protein [Helicobacter sp. UBA3407]